jgi:UTP--glucose-1-phosphate uridylyltransferase
MGRVRKAVFPVAGKGTRFLPATKAIPKEMLPLIDRPLIDYAVEEALASGIEEIILVTAPGKDAIVDHFMEDPALIETLRTSGKGEIANDVERATIPAGRVQVTRQPEARGLGHAVWCARHLVGDEPFAVILPDDVVAREGKPCLQQLIEAHATVGGHVAAVMDVPREETKSYGVLDIAADDGTIARATGLVEKPAPSEAPSTLSIIGRYVLSPEIFDELEKGRTGAGGEIQLTDAMTADLTSVPFHGVRFSGIRYDCGRKEGFLQATVAFALERDELRPIVFAEVDAWRSAHPAPKKVVNA